MKRLRGSRLAGLAVFVALVALVIAAPIAILGEVSSNDARSRLEGDEIAAVADTADRAADLVRGRLVAVADEVGGIVKNDQFGRAMDATDISAAAALLGGYKSVTSSDIDRLFVISGCGCPGLTPSVSLSVPTDERLGQLRPASDYTRSAGGSLEQIIVTTSQRIFVASHGQGPQTIAVAVARRPPAEATAGQDVVLADIPVSHLTDWLRPISGPGQRIYVLDESDRQIATAGEGDAAAQPMSAPVRDAVRGKDHVAMRLGDGPADVRNIATATVTSSGWHVVVVRPISAAELDLSAGSAQQRWLRVALIGFLLIGATLVGWFDQRLRTQGRALALASRHKSEFLANMSHELRTPLNAVIGFSDVLLQKMFGELNERQEEYVRDIREAGRHQLALVNDILDLSKVEAGRMELEPTDFSLPALITDATALLRERASQKGVRLVVATDETLGSVHADERKIKQVLFNLVMNAIKFTPSGGTITVAGERTSAAVSVSVTDTGIGIAAEDQTRIFEEFRQAGDSAGRAVEGTGLGLSLAKRFIELHRGTLSVVSEPGRGSKFVFVLPQPAVATA
ncbi:MAG: HAMP domain-containing histidine kinase [Chloroflexota bacterium]|nr:HAMP domain-containing histidine kinase [Chloroflexota bacterium]